MPKKNKVKIQIKLQIQAGKASPAPPIGPALGQHGINIQDFCNKFNQKTKDMQGALIPVIINVYEDRSYDFICKTPATSYLIKKAAKIEKGSKEPVKQKVGKITMSQLEEIAKIKLPDLNTNDLEKAKKIIAGTARQMGVEIISD